MSGARWHCHWPSQGVIWASWGRRALPWGTWWLSLFPFGWCWRCSVVGMRQQCTGCVIGSGGNQWFPGGGQWGSHGCWMTVMSKLCTQEDWTPLDYSRRMYNEPHDKSRDKEHAIRGTLQPIFYYKTRQLSIITFKSRDYDLRMAHQSGSPFTRLRKPLIDVWLWLLRLATQVHPQMAMLWWQQLLTVTRCILKVSMSSKMLSHPSLQLPRCRDESTFFRFCHQNVPYCCQQYH